MVFAYPLSTLLQHKVLSLDNPAVTGSLHDKDRFESLIYEVLVTSNYSFNGFQVSMPDLLGKERVDIYAKKNNIEVCCECKKLMRN